MINLTENTATGMTSKIRRHYDETTKEWHYSIVDAIDTMTDSADARNYWKVLKKRQGAKNGKLQDVISRCIPIKLKARDGKYYLTDTANYETILEILSTIPSAKVSMFSDYCTSLPAIPSEEKVTRAVEESESDLSIDMYQTEREIIIETMIAGVAPEDISIFVSPEKIIIFGVREDAATFLSAETEENYLIRELQFSSFSRTVTLPYKIEINKVEKQYTNGHLKIRLLKSSPAHLPHLHPEVPPRDFLLS